MFNCKTSIIVFLASAISFGAAAQTPEIDGLAGAGRAGLPREALNSNPAAAVLLKGNLAAAGYTLTRIHDAGDAGGIEQFGGVYDGSSDLAHGGVGYLRESRRISLGNNTQYADSTVIKSLVSKDIYHGILMGVKPMYTIHRDGGTQTKYFTGDVGFIYPLFTDLPLGITMENVSDQNSERPRTGFLAASYKMQGPLTLYADLGRVFSNVQKNGVPVWSLGVELKIFEELVARSGLYRDAVLDTRGFSLGLGWMGPRTSFEYAIRRSISVPMQFDQVFGIGIAL